MGIFGKKRRKPTSRRKQEPWDKIKDARDRGFVKAAATDPDARAKLIKKAYGIEIIPLDKAKQDRLAIRRAVIDNALGLATDKDISREELEETLFPTQDENVDREQEPVDNEPYRRPYPIRPRYRVRQTRGTNDRREQPITRADDGLSSSDREAASGFLKLLLEKISGASGGQTGNAGKTYAVKIDGRYVEMSAEDYAALLVRREKAKATVEGTGKTLLTKTGESKAAAPKEAAKPGTEDITPIVVPPLRADGEQVFPKPGSTGTKTQGEHPDKPTR